MIFFKTNPKWFNILGVIAGLAGAMGLVGVSGNGNFTFNMGFAILIIIASVLYAINVNTIKAFLADVKPITITAMSFFMIGPFALIYLFGFTPFAGEFAGNQHVYAGLGYIAILAVVGTGLALMIFNQLIQLTSAVFASSVTYFIPVVAVIWGIADGEHFNAGFLLWIFLVIAGVLLVNTSSLTNNRFSAGIRRILKQ